MLGPAVNIQRSPLGGRNGEYFSEDPYLAARLGVGYIQGMQSTGCAACLKHYACNNEEVDRGDVNVRVDERTLREIYLPAFEAGVKEGHVWTVMSSYNQINGHHATANALFADGRAEKRLGLRRHGDVRLGCACMKQSASSMPATIWKCPARVVYPRIKSPCAVKRNQITQAAVDDNVKRILRTIIRVGLLDGPRRSRSQRLSTRRNINT